jgi:SAM-dependent methyltransferase
MSADIKFSSWEAAVQWLREQPDRRDLVTAAYYDDPLLFAAQRYHDSEEWSEIRALLPAQVGDALDVGAGRGIASYAMARDGFSVTALEPDGSALVGADAIRRLARESGLSIEVCQEFSEKLPFANKRFDVVFARAVLHHTRDLQSACKEFLRVLKPGGIFIAVREHVISKSEDLPAFLEIHPLHKLYGGENAFMLKQYLAALSNAGFSVVDVLPPLESPINYAPHTRQSLQTEICHRISRGNPRVSTAMRWLLALPEVWRLLVPLLGKIDDRPGRLFSFVCKRP